VFVICEIIGVWDMWNYWCLRYVKLLVPEMYDANGLWNLWNICLWNMWISLKNIMPKLSFILFYKIIVWSTKNMMSLVFVICEIIGVWDMWNYWSEICEIIGLWDMWNYWYLPYVKLLVFENLKHRSNEYVI
jgi:hypothetical protein